MSDHVEREDIAAMDRQGDLKAYMRSLINTAPNGPTAPPRKKRIRKPPYHITRPGAWPCGTAPSGPSPPPCDDCRPSHDARITAWTNQQAADQQTGDTE